MKKFCGYGHDRTLPGAITSSYACKQCSKDWKIKNKDKAFKASKNWAKNHPQKLKEYTLRRNYGLTYAKYQSMLENQNGLCAICNQKPKYTLHVDHCHKSKIVRGLLCSRCNTMLGLLESPWKLKAEVYIKSKGLVK